MTLVRQHLFEVSDHFANYTPCRGNLAEILSQLSHFAATGSLAIAMGVVVMDGLVVCSAWDTMTLLRCAGTLTSWTWQLRDYLFLSAHMA